MLGHPDVVEEDGHFLAAVLAVSNVDARRLSTSRIAGLAAEDVRQAGRVHGHRRRDRVLGVRGFEALAGHDHHPVRVERPRLVHLGAPQHDAAVSPVHDADEEVRVVLRVRRLRAVAFRVRHRAAHDEVVALHVLDEAPEPRVVRRAVRGVGPKRRRPRRVEGVLADAALEARAGALAEAPLHLVLRRDVLCGRADVREAVHARVDELRVRGRELRLALRQTVRLRDRVDRRS
mmetsp:Transcript_9572/g.29818  ORF Transcript_9572/g.29818 Transcript_9572/m.29818 type:complete len:233 (+) Transcript_9572:682-1380(+)